MAYCSCNRWTSSWSFIRNRRGSRGKRPLGVWKAMTVTDWALWLLRKVHFSRHTQIVLLLCLLNLKMPRWLLWREGEQFKNADMTSFFWRANLISSLVGPCPCNAVEQTNWFTMVYLYKDTPNDQSTKSASVPTTTIRSSEMLPSSLIGHHKIVTLTKILKDRAAEYQNHNIVNIVISYLSCLQPFTQTKVSVILT